jgi:hypothetical protein
MEAKYQNDHGMGSDGVKLINGITTLSHCVNNM